LTGTEKRLDFDSGVTQMEFDLLNAKDTGLVGAIGETIAWQYLWEKGVLAYSFGAGRPWFTGKPVSEVQSGFDHWFDTSWLSKRQVDYLNDLWRGRSPRWDFVAIKRGDQLKKCKRIYPVEVKTRRSGKNRHDLRGSMRGKIPEDIGKLRRLGFRPLLLVVEFLDNWKFEIMEVALSQEGQKAARF
jgi:hypothetical protein